MLHIETETNAPKRLSPVRAKHSDEDDDAGLRLVVLDMIEDHLVETGDILATMDALLLSSDADVADRSDEMDAGGISIQTIHAAKGLEYSVVILLGLEEGFFPSSRATETEQMLEEGRFCYVALTRAKHHLIVSCVRNRYSKPRSAGIADAPFAPSRFLPLIEAAMSDYHAEQEFNTIVDYHAIGEITIYPDAHATGRKHDYLVGLIAMRPWSSVIRLEQMDQTGFSGQVIGVCTVDAAVYDACTALGSCVVQ